MTIRGIHHVAIIASDYQRSKTFYVDVLGFTVLHEIYRDERRSYKLDLALGSCRIELFSFPAPPRRPSYPEACGLRHLAFSVEDIDAFYHHLMQQNIGCESIRIDEITGYRFFFFHDPDGLPLEAYASHH